MDYEKIYHEFGFQVEPLSSDYNPDTYARELMRNIKYPEGVSYTVSTGCQIDETLLERD